MTNTTARKRADLRVVKVGGGAQWSPSEAQSNLFHLVDVATGQSFRFDSHADWRVGEVLRVSFEAGYEDYILKPRPVRTL